MFIGLRSIYESVSDCVLSPIGVFSKYIMARTNYIQLDDDDDDVQFFIDQLT